MSDFTIEGLDASTRQKQQDAETETESRQLRKAFERRAKDNVREANKAQKEVEDKEKILLLRKLCRRLETFPWLAQTVNASFGPRTPLAELKQIDELQKLELDIKGAEERIRTYILQGSFLVEAVWGDGSAFPWVPENLRLNLKGLGTAMSSAPMQQRIAQLVAETTIEYPTFGQMSLTTRWIETICSCLWTVHVLNSHPKLREEVGPKIFDDMTMEMEEGEDTENKATEANTRK